MAKVEGRQSGGLEGVVVEGDSVEDMLGCDVRRVVQCGGFST